MKTVVIELDTIDLGREAGGAQLGVQVIERHTVGITVDHGGEDAVVALDARIVVDDGGLVGVAGVDVMARW